VELGSCGRVDDPRKASEEVLGGLDHDGLILVGDSGSIIIAYDVEEEYCHQRATVDRALAEANTTRSTCGSVVLLVTTGHLGTE
jgi:hypothetical protein